MCGEDNYGRDKRYRKQIPPETLREWYERYYQRGMSLKQIGRRVGVSPRYLSELFRAKGWPVTLRVHERVIKEQ
jgi:hypothetical protein